MEFSLQRVVLMNKTPAFLLTQLGWSKDTVKDLVKASGDTLTFKITEDFAPSLVLNLMTSIVASVVEKKVALAHETNGDMGNGWLKTNSAASGAFKLVSWKANESVSLEANPGFRLGAPPMKRVVVRHVPEPASQRLLLEKADADFARDLTPDQIKPLAGNPDIKVESFKAANTFYMGLNLGYEPLANPKVRQAMKMLVDYDGMVKSFLAGRFFVQQSFLPLGFFGAIAYAPFKLDVAKAKALLAEAGYKDGFAVKMAAPNVSPWTEISQSVQQTMGQAGIKVSIEPMELKAVIGQYRGRATPDRHALLGPGLFRPAHQRRQLRAQRRQLRHAEDQADRLAQQVVHPRHHQGDAGRGKGARYRQTRRAIRRAAEEGDGRGPVHLHVPEQHPGGAARDGDRVQSRHHRGPALLPHHPEVLTR